MADDFTLHPPVARWTHIAVPCSDIDAMIDWYSRYTPLELLDRREDADGYGAWLGQRDMVEKPFVLVLVSFFRDQDKKQPTLAPFAHIGIELTSRAEIDAIAARGEAEGCLSWAPTEMPPPIGYICALKDPDGNVVEISHDQKVFSSVRAKWGATPE